MAVPLSVESARAILSYDHLRRLTNWPDILVKDYQGILLDSISLAEEVDNLKLRVDVLEAAVEALEAKEIIVVNVSEDYTTIPYRAVICTNTAPINITLNLTPELNEVVHIKRTGAEVNIIGTIDGLTDWTLNVQRYSMNLIYNGTDWSAI